MSQTKEVDFHQYCETCKYKDDYENDVESPCFDCLDDPVNIDSHKPVNYIPKD